MNKSKFQPVSTQFNYVQLRSMIGEASGAPHAHQDQPMTEARLFSDDKFNAIWTGEANLELLKRDGLVRWTWPDLYEPFSVHFISFHTPPRDKDYVGKV